MFCNQNNINFSEAPIRDHRAIELKEKLILTIETPSACIKTGAQKQFNLKASQNSNLLVTNMSSKDNNMLPFEDHFEQKPNTLFRKITRDPDPSTLLYEPILKTHLVHKTVIWYDLAQENSWEYGSRSDIETKKDKILAGRSEREKSGLKKVKSSPTAKNRIINPKHRI